MVTTSVLLIKNYPTKLNHLLSLLLILILRFLIGLLAFSTIDKVPSALERVDWSTEARWIGAPQPTYRFYARHDFDLTAPMQSA